MDYQHSGKRERSYFRVSSKVAGTPTFPGAEGRLRILIVGDDEEANPFLSILIANIQQWGHEAVLLSSALMSEHRTWSGVEGDILLYDMDTMFLHKFSAQEDGDSEVASSGIEEALHMHIKLPRVRLMVALSSHSVSRLSLKRLGAVALLHKPFDMRHLERYLRVFQFLLFAQEEYLDEKSAVLPLLTRRMRLVRSGKGEVVNASLVPDVDYTRILIADDNPEMTWSIRQCLADNINQRYHLEIREVHDGLALLEHCLIWRPQCVITDVLMPWLNGYQVMHCLSASPLQTMPAFVVISALTQHEIPERRLYLRDKEVLYVQKPFDIENLLTTLEQALTQ